MDPVRCPCRWCTGPTRESPSIVCGRTGLLRSPPHRVFPGCLQFLNLYGACKLIMHALKLRAPYGEVKFVWRHTGHVPVSGHRIFAREQPIRGLECDVTGALPWLLLQYCCLLRQVAKYHGLVQDCSNSSALAMELLWSWTRPSI